MGARTVADKNNTINREESFYSGRMSQNLFWESSLFNPICLKVDLKKRILNWDHHDLAFDGFFQGFNDLCTKHKKVQDFNWNEADTIRKWIVPILHLLGWDEKCFCDNVSYTVPEPTGGTKQYRPDLLYVEHEDLTQHLRQKNGSGNIQASRTYVEMVIEAKSWRYLEKVRHHNCNPEKKAEPDSKEDTTRAWTPEEQLLKYLQVLKKDFGILTDGAKWKLLHSTESADSNKRSFTFDLQKIRLALVGEQAKNDASNKTDLNDILNELKYFFYLFRRETFYSETPIILDLINNNKKYVDHIIEDLKSNFINTMTIVCNGYAKNIGDDKLDNDTLDLIRNTAESHVFNILFIRSCEDNGILSEKHGYLTHSLSEIVNLLRYPNFDPDLDKDDSDVIEQKLKRVFKPIFNYKSDGTDLYQRLLDVYEVIETGKFGLIIPGFKETVFSAEEKKFSQKHKLNNRDMVRLLFNLGYVKETGNDSNGYQMIPYSYFTPRQLGSIYESFLEYKLDKADKDLIYEKQKWVPANLNAKKLIGTTLPTARKGSLYFTRDAAARKNSGSYYTPDFIVRYIVNEALSPLIASKNAEEILTLKVADIAMGSAHFLNAALEYLTKAYRDRLANESYDDFDESFAESARKVLHSCIYGVDINHRAVKLAKMALWLVTAHAGRELEPLDDQLKCEDALSDKMRWGNFTDVDDPFKKGIFDAVIGNPPYLGEKGHKDVFDPLKGQRIRCYYQAKMDYFYFFIHLGIDLLKRNGRLGFITTNYFPTASAASMLRKDLCDRTTIISLVNLRDWKIFKAAQGQHNMLLTFEKSTERDPNIKAKVVTMEGGGDLNENEAVFWNSVHNGPLYTHDELFNGSEYYIRQTGNSDSADGEGSTILKKMSESGDLLGDVYNVNQGLHTGADKLTEKHVDKYKTNGQIGEGIFILNRAEIENLNLSIAEKKFLSPFYKNSDIQKFTTKARPDLWFIDISYPKNADLNLNTVPNIIKHLNRFKPILENRVDSSLSTAKKRNIWWVIGLRKQIDYNAAKIVVPQRSKTNTFGYNEVPWYASADVYFITQKEKSSPSLKIILGILNSKLMYYWLYYRGKRKGESLELYQTPLSEIPIPTELSGSDAVKIETLVNDILASKPDVKVERKVDEYVYKLYRITKEEIEIVEKFYHEKHSKKLEE